jgi:hypothetical protein
LSQNLIEAQLVDYVRSFATPTLRRVVVADRGFARASWFRPLRNLARDFDIRLDARTWLHLPDGTAGPAEEIAPIRPGQRCWLPEATYGKEERVPVSVLAVWDPGQKEPWYLATSLQDSDPTETLYRWRMCIECGNRDEKSGVILRERGDRHRLTSVLHLHRLLLVNLCTHWLAALTGLQACHDLPARSPVPPGRPLF